jgi:hypothetical protein
MKQRAEQAKWRRQRPFHLRATTYTPWWAYPRREVVRWAPTGSSSAIGNCEEDKRGDQNCGGKREDAVGFHE